MAPDQAQPRSRRALLTAAIGGAAAVLATAVGRPLDARAADGDPVLIGALNEGTATTTLRRTTKGTTLSIRHTGIDLEEGGPALEASSFYGDAVQATVGGISQTAIRATSPDGTAVVARSENAYGVVAAGAWGVKTEGTLGGVYAETTGGYNGKAVQAVATGQDAMPSSPGADPVRAGVRRRGHRRGPEAGDGHAGGQDQHRDEGHVHAPVERRWHDRGAPDEPERGGQQLHDLPHGDRHAALLRRVVADRLARSA